MTKQTEAVREPNGIAALLSFFVPGLGQLVKGEFLKALAIFGGCFVCFLTSFLILPIAGYLAIWIYGIYDAYQPTPVTNE